MKFYCSVLSQRLHALGSCSILVKFYFPACVKKTYLLLKPNVLLRHMIRPSRSAIISIVRHNRAPKTPTVSLSDDS